MAQKEALLKAHDMFKGWTESELETIRREQRDIAAREATSQLIEWKHEQEKLIRQDAVMRSQAVTLGKVTEHLVPYLPNFDYNPKDVRFIGSPVDFVIFDGLNEEEENQIRNVVFVEIKTGVSALSRRERLVRDAIRDGRVRWVEWHASNELRQEKTGLFE
ncbi:MAG: Holliday junction resolvase [Acidobacteria bacterium]|nr:Holliday junction resolvase [Acidobacteriota bacterium]